MLLSCAFGGPKIPRRYLHLTSQESGLQLLAEFGKTTQWAVAYSVIRENLSFYRCRQLPY